jgi:hypothetical protein
MTALEPAARLCVERTRSAVLNTLIGVGIGIAASGFILRTREGIPRAQRSEETRRALYGSLFALVIASYSTRRIGASRAALQDPTRRAARYFRAHLVATLIGALAIPLGLIYAWMVGPRLDAVAPFWIAALALGFSSLPRAIDLDGFDQAIAENGGPIP